MGIFFESWKTSAVIAVALLFLYFYLGRYIPRRRIRIAIHLLVAGLFLRVLSSCAVWAGVVDFDVVGRAIAAIDGFIIFSFVALVYFVIDHLFWNSYLKNSKGVVVPLILKDIIRFGLLAGLVLLILKYGFGYRLSGIVATSAVLSAIIGFALQDMLSNIIAGVALQVEKPFKVGDWVLLDERAGKVLSMSWRATRILDIDGNSIVIPNSAVSKANILNYYEPVKAHAITFDIGTDYANSPHHVQDTVLAVVSQHPAVLKSPAPKVFLRKYDDFSINYEVKVWIENHGQWKEIISDIYTRLWYVFRREKITIPFPIRTVHMHQPEATDAAKDREAQILSLLGHVEIFEPLAPVQIENLARESRMLEFGAGETIIEQGSQGCALYVVMSGVLDAAIDGRVVGSIAKGEVFGEMSLLTGEKTAASVSAKTDCCLLGISKESFCAVLRADERVVEKLARLLAARRAENEEAARNFNASAADSQQSRADGLAVRIRKFFGLKI